MAVHARKGACICKIGEDFSHSYLCILGFQPIFHRYILIEAIQRRHINANHLYSYSLESIERENEISHSTMTRPLDATLMRQRPLPSIPSATSKIHLSSLSHDLKKNFIASQIHALVYFTHISYPHYHRTRSVFSWSGFLKAMRDRLGVGAARQATVSTTHGPSQKLLFVSCVLAY